MKSRKALAETIRRKLNFVVEPPVRDELLAQALQEQEQSWNTEPALQKPDGRRMIMRISTTRIAIAALIGAGVVTAAAVGVSIQKYRFVEKRPEQGYIVRSEDGYSTMNITENHAASPEQAVETAEEIALLKQQGQRELVGVSEIEVNGQLDNRVLSYKYNLSDGRTITVGEGDPDAHAPLTLTGERLEEAGRLFRQAVGSTGDTGLFVTTDEGTFRIPEEPDEGKEPLTYERVIQGRTFTFEKYTFALSDGTQVAWSVGRLREDSPGQARNTGINRGPLPKDLQEWAALRKQGKRQLVGVRELSAGGEVDMRVHVYRYQLSDGRTIDMNEGAGGKWFLSAAQRQECAEARKAKAGQNLGTYEEEVMGRTFVFTRQRFVLSDGTELIWSSGVPKDNQ
jgi:hypothetical protein